MKKTLKTSLFVTFFGILSFGGLTYIISDNEYPNGVKKIQNFNNNKIDQQNISEQEIDNIAFEKESIYSKYNTPYGYIKYDNDTKNIKMVSYFGNVIWTYDLNQSNFIKRIANSFTISTLKTLYIPDIERIVVYGTVNQTKSFLFQLYAKDGYEYFVNPNDQNVAGSSVVDGDPNMISSLNLISYMENETIVLLPKEFGANQKINTYIVNLNSYISAPINIDFSTFLSTKNNVENITYGEIIGYSPLSLKNNTNVLFVKTNKAISSDGVNFKYESGVTAISIQANLYPIKKLYHEFIESNNSINLDECIYEWKYKNIKDDHFQINMAMVKNGTHRYGVSNEIVLYDWNQTNNSNEQGLVSKVFHLVFSVNDTATKITQIVYNFYQNKIYAIGLNSANIVQYFIKELSSASLDNNLTDITINYNIDLSVIDDIQTNTIENVDFLFIDEKQLYENPNANNFPGIVRIESNSKTFLRSYSLNNVGNIKLSNNFNPTFVHDYHDDILQYYNNYLPQDISLNILQKYIYLYNNNNVNQQLFDSFISTNLKNPLKINNEIGTLEGSVNLNLRKWWLNSDSENLNEVYEIKINLNGLATNNGVKFSVVKNSNISVEKYEQILALQQQKYPSQVTEQEIIDSFLIFGKNVNLTIDDITIVNVQKKQTNTSSNVIMVYANDNNGTLEIAYDLNKIISPSVVEKTGSYTFNNFKQLDTWQQISLNSERWTNLRKAKMPFQITKQDIVECLNLSQSYKRDLQYWSWTPTYNLNFDKANYINENIEGELSGLISYNRELGGTPQNVAIEKTKLNINPGNEGFGFLTIQAAMGNNAENCIYYNQTKANQIASSYSKLEAEQKAIEIFKESITFYENWTDINSLIIQAPTTNDNTLFYNLAFNEKEIRTNFLDSNNKKLTLDADWITMIKKNSTVLDLNKVFSFDFNRTVYKWNYGIPISSTIYSIQKMNSNYGVIDSQELKDFSKLNPSIFVKQFYDKQNNNYLKFQEQFQLLNIDKSLSKNDVSYFEVLSVDLVSNDTQGTVFVQYTINYPNIGNVSSGGVTTYPQLIISGFPTIAQRSQVWIITTISICATLILCGVLFSIFVIINRYLKLKNKTKYGFIVNDKQINIKQSNRFLDKKIFSNKGRSAKTRDTLNKDVLNHKKNKIADFRIREYTKILNDFEKQKRKEASNETKKNK